MIKERNQSRGSEEKYRIFCKRDRESYSNKEPFTNPRALSDGTEIR